MKSLNYKVKNSYSNLRRENRQDFVAHIKGDKKHKIAILSIHFNNFLNTKALVEYLQKETNQNFDIILVENSSKSEEGMKLQQYCENKSNITLIRPIHNLGSAGGYSLGMEYIIHQGYDYFFVVEDDVIFLENNIFSDLISASNEKTLTFIHGCKNCRSSSNATDKLKSRRVQTVGYPVNFVEKIGIIDPRHFFRAEDLEWGVRIQQGIRNLGYNTTIIDHNYLHPYLKSVNGNYARFYFSIRNQLLSLEKHFWGNVGFLATLFFYLRTAITKLLVNKDILILKSFFDGLKDFLSHNYSFQNNTHKISLFLNNTKKENIIINRKDLCVLTKSMYTNPRLLYITGYDRENLKFSKRIGNIFTNGILISSSSTIFYPLTLLAPNVVCIDEFNLSDNTILIHQYKNNNFITNIILIIISLVASIGIIIMVSIIVIVFIGFNRLSKKIC